jgi:orotidine-5'-phosphate decarboxylase
MLDTVPKEPKDYLCVALDLPNMIEVRRFAGMLTPLVGYEKVGLRLITSVGGPTVVHALQNDYGAEVFYDGKFHDIPKTVGEASEAAAMLGVAMFNVHASATIPAMQQARTHLLSPCSPPSAKVSAFTPTERRTGPRCINSPSTPRLRA